MFKEREDDEEPVHRLKEMFRGTPAGTVVPWEEIDPLTAAEHGTRDWQRRIKKVRKWLLRERRVVTVAVPGQGLKVLTDRENVQIIPTYRTKRAFRQIGKGQREVAAADPSRLSLAERNVLHANRQNMARQRADLRKSRKEIERILRPTETIPLRRRGEGDDPLDAPDPAT